MGIVSILYRYINVRQLLAQNLVSLTHSGLPPIFCLIDSLWPFDIHDKILLCCIITGHVYIKCNQTLTQKIIKKFIYFTKMLHSAPEGLTLATSRNTAHSPVMI